MITTEKLAVMLTDKLNEYPISLNGREYSFFIHSNEGEYSGEVDGSQKQLPTNVINGVLIEQSSTPVPLAGLNSILLMQSMEVLIPVNMAARRLLGRRSGGIDYAMQALNAFVQACAGLTGTEQDDEGKSFSYALSVSTPMVGTEDYYGEVGKAVPVSMQVSCQITENGVLSNQIKVSVDGMEVLYVEGGFERNRIAETFNAENSEELQSTITQQGLMMRVVTPYIKGGLGQTLIEDMLSGNLNRVYTVIYSDGVVTDKTLKMVATGIQQGVQAGMTVSVTATFALAKEGD